MKQWSKISSGERAAKLQAIKILVGRDNGHGWIDTELLESIITSLFGVVFQKQGERHNRTDGELDLIFLRDTDIPITIRVTGNIWDAALLDIEETEG